MEIGVAKALANDLPNLCRIMFPTHPKSARSFLRYLRQVESWKRTRDVWATIEDIRDAARNNEEIREALDEYTDWLAYHEGGE